MTIEEPNFDTLEIVEIDEHLTLLQVAEDGESNSLVIGPEQQTALLKLLLERQGD
ncbi:hypothetical protein [Novosphingobium panipatense]